MKNETWYVYVVRFNDIWLVKVWKSINPLQRIMSLIIENSDFKYWFALNNCDESLFKKINIDILKIYKTENHTILEKEIHLLLENYKWEYKREYFKIDDKELLDILWGLSLEEDFLSYKWKHQFYWFEIANSFDDIYKKRKLIKEIT